MLIQKIRKSSRAKAYLALFTTSFVWGTTWVFSKAAVMEMPALQMAAIRQFIAGLAMVAFFVFYKKLSLPSAKEFRWLFIMSLLLFVIANGFSTWGVTYISSGLAALIGTLYPLSVVLIEAVFYKQKQIPSLAVFGLVLGLMGVGLVLYENAFVNTGLHFGWGLVLSVLAMLSWSFGSVFLARKKQTLNPYYSLGWQMLLSSVLLYILSLALKQHMPISAISLKTWGIIIYLAALGSIIAFVAFLYTLKKLPQAIATLYAYINPLVAMFIGSWLLGETLNRYILGGAFVTLLGVFLVNYSIRKARKSTVLNSSEQ